MSSNTVNSDTGKKCNCVGHRPDGGFQFLCRCSCSSCCHDYCHIGGTFEQREKCREEQKRLEAERKEREFQEWLNKVNQNGGMVRCFDDWNNYHHY